MEDAEARRSRLRSMRESAAKQQAASPGAPTPSAALSALPSPDFSPPLIRTHLRVRHPGKADLGEVDLLDGQQEQPPQARGISHRPHTQADAITACDMLRAAGPRKVCEATGEEEQWAGRWMDGRLLGWSGPCGNTPLKPAQTPSTTFNRYQPLSTVFNHSHQVVITSMEVDGQLLVVGSDASSPAVEQVGVAEKVSGSAEQVSGAAEQVSGAAEQVSGAAEQVSGAAEQVSGAAEQVSGAAEQVSGAAEQVSGAAEQVSGAAEQVSGAAEQVSGAAEQVSGAAEQVSGAAEQVSGAAEQVTGAAEQGTGCVGAGLAADSLVLVVGRDASSPAVEQMGEVTGHGACQCGGRGVL
ncbi:unnamed protein product [Closterium sp. NIES-65]|nr:unnamed protein product [Closterium sp. NIES-65]